jgi:hypothetical protein
MYHYYTAVVVVLATVFFLYTDGSSKAIAVVPGGKGIGWSQVGLPDITLAVPTACSGALRTLFFTVLDYWLCDLEGIYNLPPHFHVDRKHSLMPLRTWPLAAGVLRSCRF